MTRGAERDSLRGIVNVGLALEVCSDQSRHIDELRFIDSLSGKRACFHSGVATGRDFLERVIGFEPTTSCLASKGPATRRPTHWYSHLWFP